MGEVRFSIPFSIAAVFILCSCLAFEKSSAKPTELLIGPDPASDISSTDTEKAIIDGASIQRDQRSPQFGFSDYGDYSSEEEGPRHFRKKFKHKPYHGHYGCRTHGHGCGGGSYHKPIHNGGGSFASASAGSFGPGNHHGGGSSSQAHSSSLSFGPFSISSSHAQSFSKGGGYGGYDDYGGRRG